MKKTQFPPSYYVTKATIHYGNGKNRISTSAYQIRCAPQHAELFKVIFCGINNESKYELRLYPEGSILLDGPEKYRSILKSQNEYLFNM